MEIKIYADILFAVNMLIDFYLLFFTAKLLHLKPKFFRLFISSAIGALYAVLIFFISPPFIIGLLLQIISAAIMTAIAFKPAKPRIFLKRLAVFYLTSVSLGGICFAVFSKGGVGTKLGAVFSSGILYINISLLKLVLAAVCLHFIVHTAFLIITKTKIKAEKIFSVKILYLNKILQISALYDSGNFLTDSKTGLGVCVAEWSSVKDFFPLASDIYEAAEKNPTQFKQIFCKGLGSGKRLYAFYANILPTAEKRLIAVTEENLASDFAYSLILPSDFKGENINDGTSFKGFFKHCKDKIHTA